MIVKAVILSLLILGASSNCLTPEQIAGPNRVGAARGERTVPRSTATGALFTVVTQPGYVTAIPRGPTTVRYGYRCYANYFCIGEKDIGSVSLSSPVVAVFSVDLKSMNYQVYSVYEVVVNGWSRDAWQKQYGSLDAIPSAARAFTENVELADGRVYSAVMTRTQGDHLLVQDATGVARIENIANVSRIY